MWPFTYFSFVRDKQPSKRDSKAASFQSSGDFLCLPRELRDIIYDLVLQPNSGRVALLNGNGSALKCEIVPRDAIALSKVCRQIRTEFLAVYFGSRIFTYRLFRLDCPINENVVKAWLEAIGKDSASSIRKFVLELGPFVCREIRQHAYPALKKKAIFPLPGPPISKHMAIVALDLEKTGLRVEALRMLDFDGRRWVELPDDAGFEVGGT